MNIPRFNRQGMGAFGAATPGPALPMSAEPIPRLDDYQSKNMYTYNVPTTATLVRLLSTTLNFTIAADSDFFWTKACAFVQVATAGTTYSAQNLPGITALITNGNTGRAFMSTATPLPNIFGTAQFPFILPQMTFIPRTSNVTILLQNLTSDTDYTQVHLSFIGIKAFK
jgi:hypothetical protein